MLNEMHSLKISPIQLRVKHLNELNTHCYLPHADSSHLTQPRNQLFSIPLVHFNVDLLSVNHCKITQTAPKPFLVWPCRIRSTPAPAPRALCSSLPSSISTKETFFNSGISCKCINQIIFIYLYTNITGLGFFPSRSLSQGSLTVPLLTSYRISITTPAFSDYLSSCHLYILSMVKKL